MNAIKIVLILLVSAIGFSLYGQSTESKCDTVYVCAETLPSYENGINGLMDYVMTDLEPILSHCYSRDEMHITSMYLTLTIDKQGRVIDVEYIRTQASEKCKEELKGQLLKMTGWNPGKQEGRFVCCTYQWPISCIQWK